MATSKFVCALLERDSKSPPPPPPIYCSPYFVITSYLLEDIKPKIISWHTSLHSLLPTFFTKD